MKKVSFNKKEIVKTMTYVDALKQGLVDYDDIDDFIEEWHNKETGKKLYEFLGMRFEEYKKFAELGYKGLSEIFYKGNIN